MDTLLFYTHHSVGIGHFMRSLSVARSLAAGFRVSLLCGGKLPPFVSPIEGVDVTPLPPVVLTPEGEWRSEDPLLTHSEALARRRGILLEALDRLHPAVLVVEFYPFGRMQYSTEILALLEAAAANPNRPLVFSSVRDMLERKRPLQQVYDDLGAVLCNHLYDGVLVHSDPRLVRFEQTFQPQTPLRTPVYYTGYVQPFSTAGDASPALEDPGVLVSAGGGQVGGPLLRTALDAYKHSSLSRRARMTLAAGYFLPREQWGDLQHQAHGLEGIEITRWLPNLAAVLSRARASVSQCGYNTFLDLVSAGVPSLVVPYEGPFDSEQVQRARVLAELGIVRLLRAEHLTPARLADEIEATLDFKPRAFHVDTNGAERSLAIVRARLAGRRPDSLVEAQPMHA